MAPAAGTIQGGSFPVEFRVGSIDYFGKRALAGTVLFRNATQEPACHAAYMVFFDEARNVIAAGGNWKNRPTQPGALDNGLVEIFTLEQKYIDRITSYQLIIYTSKGIVGRDTSRTAAPKVGTPASKPSPQFLPLALAIFPQSHESAPPTAVGGNDIELKCLYHIYLDDGWRLWAGGTVLNKSAESVGFSYNAAFFDADGFICGGAHFEYSPLKPGEDFVIQRPVALPKQNLERTASFQSVLYEIRDGRTDPYRITPPARK
jgi:hypothetical protein